MRGALPFRQLGRSFDMDQFAQDLRRGILSGHPDMPEFKFNESVSFAVQCKDQTEIDYYWGKLSSVPASEQCGWCKDKYGLSWQIVPGNMADLMSKPDAYKTLMKQKKIIISEY